MNQIVEKLKKVLAELEEINGTMLVFAFFLRDESLQKWDLIVSASWLDSSDAQSYKIIASCVQSKLIPQELVTLSRIVILDPDDPVVQFLQEAYNVPNGRPMDILNCDDLSQKFKFSIKQAYLFRCISML